LLRWVFSMHDNDLSVGRGRRSKGDKRMDFGAVKKLISRILPYRPLKYFAMESKTSIIRLMFDGGSHGLDQ